MGLGPRGGWLMSDLKGIKVLPTGNRRNRWQREYWDFWLKAAERNEFSSLLILENQRATIEDRI